MAEAYQQLLSQLVDVPDPPLPQRSSPLTAMSAADARKHTLTALAFAFVSGAGAGALFVYGHWIWGTIVGLVAFLFLAAAFGKKSRVAACPFCSATMVITLEDGSDPLQCEKCWEYSAMVSGQLTPLPADTISEQPKFETPLFESSRWPKACVACGAPPTRLDEIKGRSLAAAQLVVARVAVQSARVQGVPYCDAHRDSVQVKVQQDRKVRLRWSSLRMMRRYLAANRRGSPGKTGIV